jgi:hypothetical protein
MQKLIDKKVISGAARRRARKRKRESGGEVAGESESM